MRRFRDYLKEEFNKDKKLEKNYYGGLEKTRIAVEIAYHREKRGMTQSQLADMINSSQSAIARLEDPDYRSYSLNSLRKIANSLDLELIVSLREKNLAAEEIVKPYSTVFAWHQNLIENYNINVGTPRVPPSSAEVAEKSKKSLVA